MPLRSIFSMSSAAEASWSSSVSALHDEMLFRCGRMAGDVDADAVDVVHVNCCSRPETSGDRDGPSAGLGRMVVLNSSDGRDGYWRPRGENDGEVLLLSCAWLGSSSGDAVDDCALSPDSSAAGRTSGDVGDGGAGGIGGLFVFRAAAVLRSAMHCSR